MCLGRLPRRRLVLVAWACGFLTWSTALGLPTKRGPLVLWASLAVVALGVDRPRSTIRAFATTWVPLFAALAGYDLLRGASHGEESAAHTWPHLNLDLWLGQGQTPTQHLQRWLWTPGQPHWWDFIAWGVYQSHFFMPLVVAVTLWHLGHRLATPYIAGIAALSWAALATYWLYPAQPPWMTGRDGLTGPVTRIVHEMWDDLGVAPAARVFTTDRAGGRRFANTVAALPSLHAAYPMFMAIMLWGRRRRLNVLLVLYALAMGLVLVYAGEHFTFDILLGWVYAATVALAAHRLAAKWRARHRGQALAAAAAISPLTPDPAPVSAPAEATRD